MSGVQHGSRLERLLALRARIDHDIAAERRRIAGARPPEPPPWQPKTGNRVDRRLVELGTTAREVKEWAVRHGLLDAVRRGRVAEHLVDSYAYHRSLPDPPAPTTGAPA